MNPRLVCYGRRMTLSHDHYRTRCCDLYGGIIALNDWSGMIYERITIQDTRMRLPFAPHLADAQGNRIAAKQFIELTMATSETDLRRRLITTDNQKYMEELERENERLQAKVEPKTGVVDSDPVNWGFDVERRLDDGIHFEEQAVAVRSINDAEDG